MSNQPRLYFIYTVSILCLRGVFVHSWVSSLHVARERVPMLAPWQRPDPACSKFVPAGSGSDPTGCPDAAVCLQRGSVEAPRGRGIPWPCAGASPRHWHSHVQGEGHPTAQPQLRGCCISEGGSGGSCWACARHGQESGCRLSHRHSSAQSEQYWPSASLPLTHPSPHWHRAPAAAPCPAAWSWHPPRGSGM